MNTRRRGPGPWIVLVVVAVAPALALFGLHSWSADHDDGTEPAPTIDPAVETQAASPTLSTGVLAFRRVPTIVSRALNTETFGSVVSPFLGSLNDRSCGAVSVDGELIGERNADIAVIPASNQKIPVAAAALEYLGADFRYTTSVVAV